MDRSCGSEQLWIDACDRSCDWSCGSVLLWIDACDRSCDDVDWFVTERERDEYREIDREERLGMER